MSKAMMPMKPWACVVRLGGIGDNLMAASVLPQLSKTHYVEVIAHEPWHKVFENNPYIDKLTVKKEGDLPKDPSEWQNYWRQRSKEYDRFVNLSHSCEATLALLPGQSQFHWPASWRRRWCGHSYVEFVHDVAEVPHCFDPGPKFYPTVEEHEQARRVKSQLGERVIGIVLSGTRLDKIWPRFPLLVAKALQELQLPIVLFGARGREREMAKQIMEFVQLHNGHVRGLHEAISADSDLLTVRQLSALGEQAYSAYLPKLLADPDAETWPLRRGLTQLHHCDLVIGPDTGPMWAVAMEDMPKIMLLSHASPENITKHWRNTYTMHADQQRVDCWPCHQLHNTIDTCRKAKDVDAAACIADIDDSAVLDAMKAALANRITSNVTSLHPIVQSSAIGISGLSKFGHVEP